MMAAIPAGGSPGCWEAQRQSLRMGPWVSLVESRSGEIQ